MLPSLKNNRWSGLMMKASVADAGHANFELKKVYNKITSVPKAIKREVVTKLFSSIFVHSFSQFGGVLF